MSDRTNNADGRLNHCGMKIGDIVLHEGRRYYLRGLDPMSVPDRKAFLEDALTGEARMVPVDQIEPPPPGERPPLRGV
jgi:hypothetical protein